MEKLLRSEILTAEPVRVGTRRMVVHSHIVQVSIPFLNGGLVWNRPFSVRVQEQNGLEQTLPVIDKTRIIQLLILASGMLAAFWIRRTAR